MAAIKKILNVMSLLGRPCTEHEMFMQVGCMDGVQYEHMGELRTDLHRVLEESVEFGYMQLDKTGYWVEPLDIEQRKQRPDVKGGLGFGFGIDCQAEQSDAECLTLPQPSTVPLRKKGGHGIKYTKCGRLPRKNAKLQKPKIAKPPLGKLAARKPGRTKRARK